MIENYFAQGEDEVSKAFIVASLKMTQVLIKLKMDGNVIPFPENIVGEKILGNVI